MTADRSKILIVSTAADPATDSVIHALNEFGANYFRINTEAYPTDSRSSTWIAADVHRADWKDTAPFDLSGLSAVWFRRHRLPVLSDMEPAHAEYSLRESDWYLKGLLFSILAGQPDVRWMSQPLSLWQAESKLRQLQAARAVGLDFPPTLVSNNPDDVRSFCAKHDRLIAKPLKLGYFDYGSRQTATFTSAIDAEALFDESAIAAAPVIYQPNVAKAFDLRVTIVGDRVFAATIDSQVEATARTDWRQTATDLAHERHSLPADIERRCLLLMRELDLAFGALDFVLTPDGRYVFLEVNPNGQWLWLEEKLEFPIAEAVALWLIGTDA